ncbi:hypothetical protein CANARDRAFT_195104 [[Candida] arabinofermentans NRRL YB-2248]|uniref:Large ribosomal subunit protein uL23m n=1 Tax=[Candida] arabinofermentans NRRL YB-2248 TaxID=983967 RepID=A0A1E4T6X4_9ASCO|nr:hypothetical protein CANARDRAFT_195104 [[Candida] arabinofermentans NRRL YB-2248]
MPPKRKPVEKSERAKKSKAIVQLVKEALEKDEPHFSVGSKKLFFPSARICLLRPNAKHTPYQAKFIVPKSFNKLDLRDYLYHIYNLRVLNITSTLTPAKFDRSLPMPYRTRFRSPQFKKMTVDLMDPFVWPAETKEFEQELELVEQLKIYGEDKNSAVGSDLLKPTKAFGGIIDQKPRAMNFIPKKLKRQMRNTKRRDVAHYRRLETEKLIEQYVALGH